MQIQITLLLRIRAWEIVAMACWPASFQCPRNSTRCKDEAYDFSNLAVFCLCCFYHSRLRHGYKKQMQKQDAEH